MLSKRALQIAIAIGGLVPIGAGLAGVIMGPAMTGTLSSIPADSHFRYLSGLLLGIGIGFWTTIPDIEQRRDRFFLLVAIVFVGGLARLWSLLTIGVPNASMLFGLMMELVITPLLAFWQYRMARQLTK